MIIANHKIKNVQIFFVDWNFDKHEGGGGVGGVLFKPWKSFPAANNGGPMTVKESDQ